MKHAVFELKLLTPAMIAGAFPKTTGEQLATAEMRASSIRGMLRWWHRFLGLDRASENRIFGSTAGDHGHASGFVLRVVDPPEPVGEPHTAKDIGLYSQPIVEYLAFNLRLAKDARSMIRTGTTFHVALLNRRLSADDWQMLLCTMRTFSWLGALGTRSRRCFGALTLVAEDGKPAARPATWSNMLSGDIEARTPPGFAPQTNYTQFLIRVGNWLREKRSIVSDKNRLFGTARPGHRCASAILLRPDWVDGNFRLLALGRTSDLDLAGIRLPRLEALSEMHDF